MWLVFYEHMVSNLGVVEWLLSLLLSFFFVQFRLRQFHHTILANLFYSTFTITCTVYVYCDHNFCPNELGNDVQNMFKANCQVQPKTQLHIGNHTVPCSCSSEVVFVPTWTTLQNLFTCQATIKILPCAIFLESSIKSFSFHCYNHMCFPLLQHLVKPWYYSNSVGGVQTLFCYHVLSRHFTHCNSSWWKLWCYLQ